jgi:hypothetical protein
MNKLKRFRSSSFQIFRQSGMYEKHEYCPFYCRYVAFLQESSCSQPKFILIQPL